MKIRSNTGSFPFVDPFCFSFYGDLHNAMQSAWIFARPSHVPLLKAAASIALQIRLSKRAWAVLADAHELMTQISLGMTHHDSNWIIDG